MMSPLLTRTRRAEIASARRAGVPDHAALMAALEGPHLFGAAELEVIAGELSASLETESWDPEAARPYWAAVAALRKAGAR